MILKRDGWVVSWAGSDCSGLPSGRVWFADDANDAAVEDTNERKSIYGHGNVVMKPHYVTERASA